MSCRYSLPVGIILTKRLYRAGSNPLLLVMTATIAVAIQDRPTAAPQTGDWEPDWHLAKAPSFTKAVSAVSSIVFAFSGTPGFFPIAAEMRNPVHYTKALLVCQGFVTAMYIVVGCVICYYCGSYVASPALGSAGVLVKKVAYGIALPGLLVSTTIVLHVSVVADRGPPRAFPQQRPPRRPNGPFTTYGYDGELTPWQFCSKLLFVRILRGSKHLTGNTFTHWATWLGCTFVVGLVAYLIASGIPDFNALVSLIGALFGTLMSFQPMGCMWLYDSWSEGRKNPSVRWGLMVAWSAFVIVSGMFIMVAGTYSSVVGIIDAQRASGGSSAWSCADNSNSS